MLFPKTLHPVFTSGFMMSWGSIDRKQIKMTEDHRITSYPERLRIQELGEPLRDGETRLCGMDKIALSNQIICVVNFNEATLDFFFCSLIQV